MLNGIGWLLILSSFFSRKFLSFIALSNAFVMCNTKPLGLVGPVAALHGTDVIDRAALASATSNRTGLTSQIWTAIEAASTSKLAALSPDLGPMVIAKIAPNSSGGLQAPNFVSSYDVNPPFLTRLITLTNKLGLVSSMQLLAI